ncbi:MAG: low temperature requirement protein A [Actinomycetota bacterium]
MRGLDVPDAEDDYTADPVELFFDLAFVFAFSQLVAHLIHHPDWGGAGDGLLLFMMLWLPWSQFTWAANTVPGNRRSVRFVMLVATVVSVPMAASVTTAFGDGGPLFAISIAVIAVLGISLLALATETGSEAYRTVITYSWPNLVAAGFFAAGSFLDEDARRVAWIVGLAITTFATIRASSGSWIVRPGHFSERHGLILIVALGEVIVAIARPVVEGLEEGAGLPGTSVLSLIAAGAFAAILFWTYFDRVQPAFEHATSQRGESDRPGVARDLYTYFHILIVGGVILAAAAVEEAALHPDEPLPLAFRTMLFFGIASFLLGVVGGVYRAYRFVAIERLTITAVLAVVIFAASDIDGMPLLLVVDAILLVMLAAEHRRVEARPAATAESETAS